MSKAQKAANSVKDRNYQQEVGAVPRGNAGEQSYALADTKGGDRKQVNTSRLLESILDRNNLNAAYKRVKRNGGSHGIDEMKVDALLPYLQEHGANLRASILADQ